MIRTNIQERLEEFLTEVNWHQNKIQIYQNKTKILNILTTMYIWVYYHLDLECYSKASRVQRQAFWKVRDHGTFADLRLEAETWLEKGGSLERNWKSLFPFLASPFSLFPEHIYISSFFPLSPFHHCSFCLGASWPGIVTPVRQNKLMLL